MLNLGLARTDIVFDLEMPQRPYTDVDARPCRTGLYRHRHRDRSELHRSYRVEPSSASSRSSISRRSISRATRRSPLQETSFPYLHIELTVSARARRCACSHFSRRWSSASPFRPAARPRRSSRWQRRRQRSRNAAGRPSPLHAAGARARRARQLRAGAGLSMATSAAMSPSRTMLRERRRLQVRRSPAPSFACG